MGKALKGLLKRRLLFATLAAITVFGGVYGFAATLNLTSNKLAAGNATVASCETSTPNTSFTVAYDATLNSGAGGYKVGSVVVSNLDAACATKPVNVTLQGASAASLGEITSTVPAGGGTLTLTPASAISAAGVVGVSAAING